MSVSNGFIKNFTSPVLSSEVGDVQFRTDQQYAVIFVHGASYDDVVYSARLYPDADNVCTAYQLGDVITQWMIDNCFSFCSFSVSDSVTGISASMQVLLCTRVSVGLLDGFSELAGKPLLSSRVIMAPLDGCAFFHFIPSEITAQAVRVKAAVNGFCRDLAQAEVTLFLDTKSKDNKIASLMLRIPEILDLINEDIDDEEEELTSISSIVMHPESNQEMSASVYVSHDPDLVGFCFSNCFGLLENIFLHAEISPQVSVDMESAVVGHRTVAYDVESSQSFKVEAANINQSDWPRVSQFLTSPEIYEVSSGRSIILSEISQEPPKTYDAMGSLKFSFSYEDDRMVL